VLALATYVRKELGIDHLVVDSLMKCGIGVDDLTGQKDFVDGLCAIARDTGLHIHLVCHMRKGENERLAPGKFDIKGAGEITDMVDNINIVWKNLRKAEKDEAELRSGRLRANRRPAAPPVGRQLRLLVRQAASSQQFLEHERVRPIVPGPAGRSARGGRVIPALRRLLGDSACEFFVPGPPARAEVLYDGERVAVSAVTQCRDVAARAARPSATSRR
jgi:hypothetical protein